MARLQLVQSASLLKAASTFYNLANVEVKSGRDVDAIEHHRAPIRGSRTSSVSAKQAIADSLKKVGQIDIRAPQGATVSVDGKALAALPTEPVPVSPGRHAVEGSRNGVVRSVTVEPMAGEVAKAALDFPDGGSVTPPPHEVPGSSWSTTRIVTVSTLAALAITGGVLSLVFRSNAQDNVDAAKEKLQGRSCVGVTGPNCSAANDLMSERDTNVTLSTVSLIGGAAFAAGAVATAIFWPKSGSAPDRNSTNAARLVPVGSVGYGSYGGLSVVGRF